MTLTIVPRPELAPPEATAAALATAQAALTVWLLSLPPDEDGIERDTASPLQVALRGISELTGAAVEAEAAGSPAGMTLRYAHEFVCMVERALWQFMVGDRDHAPSVADTRVTIMQAQAFLQGASGAAA